MIDFTRLTPAGMHNPRIKQFLGIKKNTKSNPEDLTCLEGLWELSRAFKANLELRAFFLCPELLRGDEAKRLAEIIVETGVHSYLVSEKVIRNIMDRDDPDGLAAIVRLPHFTWSDIQLRQQNRLVVLDGLEIPGNIGTIVRCADSTGADGIVITNRRTRLSHPKLIHSSMGSLFTFPVIEAEIHEAIAWLHNHQFRIITTDTEAPLSYKRADYRGRIAIVMGSERYGIVEEWHQAQDSSVFIPMQGTVDSLNVGNAAVLMLYEAFYQQEPVRF